MDQYFLDCSLNATVTGPVCAVTIDGCKLFLRSLWLSSFSANRTLMCATTFCAQLSNIWGTMKSNSSMGCAYSDRENQFQFCSSISMTVLTICICITDI